MKILVTGFKPFLGEKLNPSEVLANYLSQSHSSVESLILPVEFTRAFAVLSEHLEKEKNYDILIMIGQAAGRSEVCLEKIALNWIQTQHPDEAGKIPPDAEIISSQALALMTRFPVDRICKLLNEKKLPVTVSFSAGTYVCNELYYRVLSALPNLESIFIHVPLVEEQVRLEKPRPYIDLEKQKEIFSEIINQCTAVGAIR